MEPEVPLPLLGERSESEAGGGRWGRPPIRRPRGLATESMLEGADRVKAQLASVVVNAEAGHRGFPGLRPLPATGS